MDYDCMLCGGECRNENGITYCVRCGFPCVEEPQPLFAALSDAYALCRAGEFAEAEARFRALRREYPTCAQLYWGVLLCRYGIVYERQVEHAFPICTIVRRRNIFEDNAFRYAIRYAQGALAAYYRSEAVRLENARRNAAYRLDSARAARVDYYAYEELDDAVYERDLHATRRKSVLLPALVAIALFSLAVCIAALLVGYLRGRKPPAPSTERFLLVALSEDAEVYAGQSPEVLRDRLTVLLSDAAGESVAVTDYAISGTLKAGDCVVEITYGEYSYALTVHVSGKDGTYGLVYRPVEGGYAVSDYRGREKSVVIPDYYAGESVVAIAANAFSGKEIEAVEIGAQVREIGASAFEHSALTSIVVPVSVETIGDTAFHDCPALAKAEVLSSTLGKAMFGNCVSLREVSLADDIRIIANSCFAQCTALSEIELPASLEEIHSYAFAACVSLRTIYFPSTLQSIGAYAFSYIGAVSYPYFSGDWDAVEKGTNWNAGTVFGALIG